MRIADQVIHEVHTKITISISAYTASINLGWNKMADILKFICFTDSSIIQLKLYSNIFPKWFK